MVLTLLEYLPRPEHFLHAIQLLSLSVSAYVLFLSLQFFVAKNSAIIIASFFALYPTNIIYAHYILTETVSQTIVSVLIYLALRWTKDKKIDTISKIFFLSCIATLLKYPFIIYAGFTGIALITKRPVKIITLQYIAAGTLIIGIWIAVNHTITGTWGI